MTVLDRIAESLGYSRKADATSATLLRRTGGGEQFDMPGYHLAESQGELYQRLSWVQVAVSAVATTAATTALNVMRLESEETVGIPNHPFETLMRRPNPLMSRYEFLAATFSFQALTGNGYWWQNKANENAVPTEQWVLPSGQVKPVPDGNMFLRGYLYDPQDGGPEIPLEPWEVVHFKRFNPNSWFTGLSPIEALATVAVGDMAMQKWNTNLFDKDNAKMPGALAFQDPIADPIWESMKDEIRREHGGVKRNMMMLRNAGKGVNWIPMAMSQSDMEFMEGRAANKEEIFSMYAPGLASMLAINATEANSINGKKTFIDLAVWPQLVSVSEKITNDVLPAYGENLTAEFEDIRITDREMALAEQNAFARVHTIDEVRAEFFNADPIGDERGVMLVAEIAPATAPQLATAQEMPDMAQDTSAEPESPQSDAQPATDEDDEPDNEQAKRRETKALKNWLKRRKNPDLAQFDNLFLTDDEVKAIAGVDAEDVDGADAPFPVVGWESYP
jgi:HK97 family phage portal protein